MEGGGGPRCRGLSGLRRIIGRFGGPGPRRLVCLAGIHGNEPSGVWGLQRVFHALEALSPAFRGELVGVAGNLKALSHNRRHTRRDLNRVWTVDRVVAVQDGDVRDDDDAEQLELIRTLREELGDDPCESFFVDLHTTSGGGAPFVLTGDTLRNRSFSLQFPVPVILGLEERLAGTVTEYVNTLGPVTLGFEAGQHDCPASVDRQEAAVWIAIVAAGLVDGDDVREQWSHARSVLQDAARGLPRILDIRYRHAVSGDDGFAMEPGFESFHSVSEGQHVARDRHGVIVAPLSGRILLPLYQAQGDDGFFLARKLNPFWLTLSAFLRHIRADALVCLLPGVRRTSQDGSTLLVNPSIARWLSVELFHLLGFRRRRMHNGYLVFTRREHDDPQFPVQRPAP